jgi:Protein of unknown function (DUF3109)
MFVSNIIPVEDVLVRSEIFNAKFECNLDKCKGACCTLESEFGAPLLEEEVGKIAKILDIIKVYLPKIHVDEIEENGFYEVKNGEFLTRSINNRACVFVYYDGEIAKCGIERAFLDKKVKFKKPISCHLFPIRVSKFGGPVLKYEKFSGCKPALEKGENNNLNLIDFCRESLIRLYGSKWYSKLTEIIGK